MMYKTRRFKALNGANEPYSAVVEKIAIYNKRGKMIDCCVIHKDNDGREFYYPSNLKNECKLFINKPKDALDCIQNRFGDALTTSSFLGFNSLHVIRYIDREYGEKIREKTLEGWKDGKMQNLHMVSNFHILIHLVMAVFGKMEHGMNSIYWSVFHGMNEEKRSGNKEYEMSVVQVLLH